ncbi:MAG TPA: hypothetical protein DCK95_04895 [Anaerolineaceae bacterium]|uniref:Transglycosylase SLT domain-containing protein n=1 Tax=Anaerolinea thermophila TaxID=167964 RepID=A0A124FN29_9CHLR|nr:MAG: hypothetical protein XD73_0503 [Anaerolinea thermophila]HAF61645.1 hypothetical protein [Anaerolineaceae bacterium]
MNTHKYFFPAVIVLCGMVLGLITLTSSPRVTLAASSVAVEEQLNPLQITALSSSYPPAIQQWEELISRHATQYGLDPNLIAALILQESGGNAQAYSTSGAVGLMQIMPRDGIAQSFMCNDHPCFQNRPSMQELYDPQFNIDYGTRYLANLISKYGDEREALYHYGPYDTGYRYADTVLAIYSTYQ